MNFHMDNRAGITSWTYTPDEETPTDKREILYSVRDVNGKQRGYSHICFPFGPADEDFPGFPQHGWVRTNNHYAADVYFSSRESRGAHRELTVARWHYPRRFNNIQGLRAECVTYEDADQGVQTLDHRFTLARGYHSGDVDVPVSVGIHWYFATHCQNFTVDSKKGHMSWVDIEKLNKEPMIWSALEHGSTITLTVAGGKIAVTILEGYDEFAIWSDDVARYICVEPVVGRLRKNRRWLVNHSTDPHKAVWVGRCELSFTPSV